MQKSNWKIAVLLIFITWISYEWIFFFNPLEYGGPVFLAFTFTVKLGLPILLILIIGMPSINLLNRNIHIGLYIIFFVLFILWATFPTLLFGDFLEILKLIPRFLLFVGTLTLFIKYPAAISAYGKLIFCVVLLALFQYFGNYLFRTYESAVTIGGALMSGPYYLFGNVTSKMYFPGIDGPVLRLVGFWNEPSNASGTAFSSFFITRYIYNIQHNKVWKFASYFSLLAGLLCFSNAGYLAFGVALIFGSFVAYNNHQFMIRFLKTTSIILFASLFVLLALFGRSYVGNHYSGNSYLRAVVGLRDIDTQMANPNGGRIELVATAISEVIENPLGMGIQSIGNKGISASASAPVYWFYFTGIVGFIFLLFREGVFFSAALKCIKKAPVSIFLVQAWIVILIQQLSYGSWMNPNYLIISAAVLSLTVKKRVVDGYQCSPKVDAPYIQAL